MRARLGLAWIVLGLAGCGGGGDEVEALLVRTTTGTDATDQDIFFCFTRPDSALPECHELETDKNDFEVGQTDQFMLELNDTVPWPGGVKDVAIEDHGNGFLSGGWHLAGLEIRVQLDDDTSRELCAETGLDVPLDQGQRYDPPACP